MTLFSSPKLPRPLGDLADAEAAFFWRKRKMNQSEGAREKIREFSFKIDYKNYKRAKSLSGNVMGWGIRRGKRTTSIPSRPFG
jgi:hypothetical protein